MTGATGNQPVTIWLEQDYNGGKMAASYTPTNGAFDVDGQWITVTFTLDQAIIQVGNEFSQWDMGQQININPCGGPNGGWGMNSGDVNIVKEDNFLLLGDMPIPEPGTIALLTFGGLGALVAIRRRRA